MTEIKICDIKVGERYRKDFGDIDSLCRSIESVGLLQPIVLDPKNRLLGGERRVEAFKRLGRDAIPFVVANNVNDATSRLIAERDENTCRKEFCPSEKIALADRIAEMVRAEAEKRRDSKLRQNDRSGNLPERNEGDSRDIIGAAIGMSGKSYEKAKAVVDAAKEDPERFGGLVEKMDSSGKVDGAYRELMQLTNPKPPTDDTWTLSVALEALTERIEYCAERWPREHREMFRMHLEHAAEDAMDLLERIDGSG